ncbi:hypothetical protein EYF80_065333 [Liparis tanakae]|uniref:Uncharacterized protein n=1 Tax=Liparis tanakae TaxID=230148 RepID=A0A4Z2E713_9TELE|nr:hypothetical protein EYF80_065333 [Liparis tanakae]
MMTPACRGVTDGRGAKGHATTTKVTPPRQRSRRGAKGHAPAPDHKVVFTPPHSSPVNHQTGGRGSHAHERLSPLTCSTPFSPP